MHHSIFTTGAVLVATLGAANVAQAQTNIGGALSGTLAAGVYHCTSNISVATGQTLTVNPGVVIKFNLDQTFTIDGTLLVNGAGANKVVFTDINDDTAGGDSNGNGGATSPAANWWRGLVFGDDSDASALANFEVRYGGRNGFSSLELQNTNLTLSNGLVRNGMVNGIDLNNAGGRPTVSNCTVQSHPGAAIAGVGIDAVPGFTNNSASGTGGNYIAITNGTLSLNTTIGSTNGIGGVLYFAVSASVPAGRTLTLGAGTIIKTAVDVQFTIAGTLNVTGTVSNRVYFTDIADDSLGGDSNANGASSGSANWWRGLVFSPGSSASTVNFAELRFGGRNVFPGFRLTTSSPVISNCRVTNWSTNGIDLNNTVSFPTVSNCVVQNCTGVAIAGVKLDAVPGFTNNTATANSLNALVVSDGTLTASRTIAPANGINGVLYVDSSIAVPSGMSLTLQSGTIVKWGLDHSAIINGSLFCNGAGGNKVVFTDFSDDSAGGDTNNNGASSGSPNWWRGIQLNSGAGGSNLVHTEVRYGGRNNFALVEITGSNPTLTSCTLRHSQIHALDLNGSTAYPNVTSCKFENNLGYAVRDVRLDALPGFSSNLATGNGGNLIEVTVGTLALDTTIGPADGLNGTFVIQSTISVPVGRTLALQPGVNFKMALDTAINVSGTLSAIGSSGSNVVFTDFNDDTVGGDTNNNGNATVPAANWWRGLNFSATADASALDFAEVRYAGRNAFAAIEITDADISVARSVIRNFHSNGIDLNNSAATPRINRCLIQNGLGVAITGVQIDSVPFITRNTASGNSFDQMQVTSGVPAADLYLQGGIGVNNVIVMTTNISVPAGRTLRLGPGAAIKFPLDGSVTIDGALKVEGSAAKPVIFTDYNDDTVGGDSNGNGGASLPAANWWRGVTINAGAAASSVEHLNVRYSGRNVFAGISCASPLARLQHCRVDRTQHQGFKLSNAARASHLVAWNALGSGIQLDGGSFDLLHASVNACGTGITKNGAGWSGSVVSSIAFGNGTNFSNLNSAQVRYSTTFTGGVGNLSSDPLFTNAALGDLTLQTFSPCLGAGDPFLEDDADCSVPDMGAYPRLTSAAPFSYCAGKANSAGCTPFLTFSGFASSSSSEPFVLRCYSALNNKSGIFYYGLSGALAAPFQGGLKCVAPPTYRLPLINSGGTPTGNDCSGVFEYDFNAHIQGGGDPQLIPGATVNVQCWYRDPAAPSASGLSDGLQFNICN